MPDPTTIMVFASMIFNAGSSLFSVYKSAKLASNTTLLQLYVAGLTNQIEDLSVQINDDATLRAKITDAFNQKDLQLSNAMLTASPFGSYYKQLKKKRDNITKAFNDHNTKLLDQQAKTYEESAKLKAIANKLNALYPTIAGGSVTESNKSLAKAKAIIEGKDDPDTNNIVVKGETTNKGSKTSNKKKVPPKAQEGQAVTDTKKFVKQDVTSQAKDVGGKVADKAKGVVSGLENVRQAAERGFKNFTDFIVDAPQKLQNLINGGIN